MNDWTLRVLSPQKLNLSSSQRLLTVRQSCAEEYGELEGWWVRVAGTSNDHSSEGSTLGEAQDTVKRAFLGNVLP